MVVRLKTLINANTKNPQMTHSPCQKYFVIYRTDLIN